MSAPDFDARKIPLAAQEDLRRRVVAAVEGGMGKAEASRVFHVHPNSVYRWTKAVAQRGKAALGGRRRGRRPAEQKRLSPQQQHRVRRVIVNRTPEQVGGSGVLWTRAAVRDHVRREFGVSLSLPSIGKYLRSWGLSPQKPVRRAYEQDPAKVRAWLAETYPGIVAAARQSGGIVVWLDESGVSSTPNAALTWAPIGATPRIGKSGQRFRVNLMAAITNRGALNFTVYDGSLTIDIYLDFLARLVRHFGVHVHLIVDGHPTHKAKTVKAWLAEHADAITQYFLPGYSPELNPVELLNADTKAGLASQPAPRNRGELTAQIRTHLHRRQKQPGRIKALFGKPEVAYAAT